MKMQPIHSGDYIVYHIDPVQVYADKGELATLKDILGQVARQYYEILSKPQRLALADDIIEKAIRKVGEI